jgi:hypothetical protein
MKVKTKRFIGVFLLGLPCTLYAAPTTTPSPNIPQDLTRLATANGTQRLVPEAIQKWRDSEFDVRYFSPWHRKEPAFRSTVPYFVKSFATGTFYGENKLAIPTATVSEMIANMATANYPSRCIPGITVTHTSLRIIPTQRPFFKSFELAGEGYPFDYVQETGIPANTPVLMTHISQDQAWALVETAELSGWLPVQEVASIEDGQIRAVENRPAAVLIQDQFPMTDTSGQFLWTARIGMRLPVMSDAATEFRVGVFRRNLDGNAVMAESIISKQMAQLKPLPLTAQNLALIGNQLMGQNYGWGDLFGNRDCSSMLQDMMIPFGIWLPRNGNDQGKAAGYYISLNHLSPEDKEKTLIQSGIPFLTLLWLKGHIMLYVGSENGKALAFHNIWGIRTKSAEGKEGRYILGKAMITTLSPGKSVPDADPDSDILKRLEAMTVLMPKFY